MVKMSPVSTTTTTDPSPPRSERLSTRWHVVDDFEIADEWKASKRTSTGLPLEGLNSEPKTASGWSCDNPVTATITAAVAARTAAAVASGDGAPSGVPPRRCDIQHRRPRCSSLGLPQSSRVASSLSVARPSASPMASPSEPVPPPLTDKGLPSLSFPSWTTGPMPSSARGALSSGASPQMKEAIREIQKIKHDLQADKVLFERPSLDGPSWWRRWGTLLSLGALRSTPSLHHLEGSFRTSQTPRSVSPRSPRHRPFRPFGGSVHRSASGNVGGDDAEDARGNVSSAPVDVATAEARMLTGLFNVDGLSDCDACVPPRCARIGAGGLMRSSLPSQQRQPEHGDAEVPSVPEDVWEQASNRHPHVDSGDATEFEAQHELLARWLDSADMPPRSADRAHKPHVHKSSLRASYSKRLSECEGDGTVGPEPKSPPVVGRRVNIELEASLLTSMERRLPSGPLSVTMPRLQRDVENAVFTRAPWPPEGGLGPGLKAQALEASASETPSVFAFLRNHFADIDVDNSRQVCENEFVSFVVVRTKRECGWHKVPADFERLLCESALRCYRQAVVRDDGIRVEDWVHFGLLLTSSPSHLAHHFLNQRLRRELRRNPFLLKEILHAFEEADIRGAGVLQAGDIEATFVAGETFVKDMDLKDTEQVSYYDFVAYCLGYRKTQVSLNWYDVSYGYAGWVPPSLLGGQQFHGVWHTGVVVFGKEYWYGGKVLSSEPGQAPFPPGPVKTTLLGTTLRTREELEDFLRFEMAPRYTREKYDVLRRNCNHFTDEVVSFLIQGCHIPDEARFQPEIIMSAPILEGIRPYLNRWLGGFEAAGCDAEIDDLMTEWRARLWPGDLALFVPQAQLHEPIRLVRVSKVDAWRGLCNISYFESHWPAADGASSTREHSTCVGISTNCPKGMFGEDNLGGTQSSPGDACREEDSSEEACVQTGNNGKGYDPCLGIPGVSLRHSNNLRVLRLGSCVHSGSYWDWTIKHRTSVPLTALRPHTLNGRGLVGTTGAGLGHIVRAGLRASNPELQTHLRRKAIVYAHCPQGHVMRPVQPERDRRSWDDFVQQALVCGICKKVIPRKTETRLECSVCSFYFCSTCDRKGLFRGYYSLGSIDSTTARLLLQETAWVRYKSQRYMAAAGASSANGVLDLDLWHNKVAHRLFADLGTELPCKSELLDMFKRFATAQNGQRGGSDVLDCTHFTDLLLELLALHAAFVSL
eukprot:TRINITY_DN23735_c0_g1_i1.p1 TRINITY_DN23735_c0_g1~~TRINITY_DN23735_c0_g1_i1.p1  ORF type:complete len:1215 (+),score=117.84 TRINITY_DN23735_c0_g1_i1:148-3792(+)